MSHPFLLLGLVHFKVRIYIFVIWYIQNGISYKVGLDIWLIEIIFLLLRS